MLSVAIIGQNAETFLPGCLDSVRTALKGYPYEILYVDAHSSDTSVSIALSGGVRVLVPDSRHTTPALGRHIAAVEAVGDQILFLDHDMRLMPGFVEAAVHEMKEGGWQGAAGQRKDIYLARGQVMGTRDNYFDCTKVREAPVFGGAVLLDRGFLLKAGNWAAAVPTYEEVELYARLKKHHGRVVELPVPMIEHLDEQRDTRSLWGILFNRRRLGLGQAVLSAIKGGSLWHLLRLEAPAFLVWLLDMLSLLVLWGLGGPAWLPLLGVQLALFVGCWLTRGPRSYVTHSLLVVYLPAGMLCYRRRNLAYTRREKKEKT